MKAAIVYTSKTGNTARLAETIRDCFPNEVIYCGAPGANVADAALLFAGFWTDKGTCGEEMAAFLRGLNGKKVFLFGTAGFGGSADYFDRILAGVRVHLNESNTVVGSYLCQGRMPQSVRERYAAMLASGQEGAAASLESFDRALSHPDAEDLARLAELVSGLAE